MDHGVINSQSHIMMVCINIRLHDFASFMIVTVVPGIVSFIVQLQQTHINVIWQVGLFDIMFVLLFVLLHSSLLH